ncbi:MAG: hypothetical protein ABMB14_20200 [Myxococcota bacterium]
MSTCFGPWLLGVVAAALSPSLAFAPNGSPSPAAAAVPRQAEPHRVLYFHDDEQGRLLASPAWRRFAETDGVGWTARFDEATHAPKWMWGRGIPMPAGSAGELVPALTALLERHAGLLGITDRLTLRSASYAADVDTWYVDLDVLRDGLRTWRGGISARVERGNLVLLTVGTAARLPVTGSLDLGPDEAVGRAIADGPVPDAVHTDVSTEPILLERRLDGHLQLRTSWLVRTRTADPPGRWVTFVDAETGAILSVHDEVRYASGTITGRHHERTVDGQPLVEDPIPLAVVSSGGSNTLTDENGDYTLAGNGPYDTEFDGGYVTVSNDAGGEGRLSGNNADLTWTTGEASQAEIDTYVFVNQVRVWGEETAPEVGWVQGPINAIVNINQACNAFWDGQVNFFSSGGGCNNTGQIADVVYHEWGHGFHYYSILSGEFDGSLSEGAGDTTAFLQTHDSEIGPHFFTSGPGIRDVAPDQRYPQDFVNNDYLVHENGLIFGGAFWDLLGLLTDAEGLDAGTRSTSHVFAGTLKGGSDIPGSFFEALVADDDDGNLENGTPHVCELYDAFGRHGLPTGGGGPSIDGVLVTHDPVVSAVPNVDVPVAVDLLAIESGCRTVGARSGAVHFRVNGGSWDQAALSTGGTAVDGSIPAQPFGATVEYYVDGVSDDGAAFVTPSGGPIAPYTFYVGDVLEIRCDDFERDDGGYQHELVSGEVADGADDWQWGAPTGQGGDPSGAFSGGNAWGNDLGFEGFNGQYQSGKVNRLASPKIDPAHYTDVFVQYRRWLQIQDGDFDQAVITVDGTPVWSNFVGPQGSDDDHRDTSWVNHAVALEGLGDRTKLKLGFELHSNNAGEFGGWTIDDVCVLAPATPDNRLGITDFVAEPTDDTIVHLSWTNPKHRPVEKVRVVRRLDRFPTGWSDGDLAEELSAPEPGAKVELDDVNGHPGATFYAVYGFDGTDWLSWTIEGWNADGVDLVGGDVPPQDAWDTGAAGEEDDEGSPIGGCSCDAGGVGPLGRLGWVAGLGILAVGRRRARVSPA